MDERGQTLVEYALLLMLIAIVVIGAVLLVGEQTNSLYQRVVDEWPSP
jgi:pilus assembly protein Flp/PilA